MIEETLAKLKQLSLKGPIKAEGTSANEVGKIFRRELGINHTTSSKNKLTDLLFLQPPKQVPVEIIYLPKFLTGKIVISNQH